MQLVIDTNIIIDVLLRRQPFYDDSKKILDYCEQGFVRGYISASAFTDIFYLIRKNTHDTSKTYELLENILNIVEILPVTDKEVVSAFSMRAKDFEDCLVATCAKVNHCDAIITRNAEDFKDFGMKIITPEEFMI